MRVPSRYPASREDWVRTRGVGAGAGLVLRSSPFPLLSLRVLWPGSGVLSASLRMAGGVRSLLGVCLGVFGSGRVCWVVSCLGFFGLRRSTLAFLVADSVPVLEGVASLPGFAAGPCVPS